MKILQKKIEEKNQIKIISGIVCKKITREKMIKFRYKRKEAPKEPQQPEQTKSQKSNTLSEKQIVKCDKITTIKRANSSNDILDDGINEYASSKIVSLASCINAVVVRI